MPHGTVAPMPTDEKFHPIQVGFFSAQATVLVTNVRVHRIQKPHGLAGNGAGFHGIFITVFLHSSTVQALVANGFLRIFMNDLNRKSVFIPQVLRYT